MTNDFRKVVISMCECNENKKDNTIAMVMAIIGIVVVVAGVAFAVYKFVSKRKAEKELFEAEDFEDDEALIELDFTYPDDEVPVEVLTEEEE